AGGRCGSTALRRASLWLHRDGAHRFRARMERRAQRKGAGEYQGSADRILPARHPAAGGIRMEEKPVQYRLEGQQAILTLDRPQARNALSSQAIRELIAAIRQADADPQSRVIVVTGGGERAFSGAPGRGG